MLDRHGAARSKKVNAWRHCEIDVADHASDHHNLGLRLERQSGNKLSRVDDGDWKRSSDKQRSGGAAQ